MRADHPLQLALGLTIWALWFVAAYGGVSVACAVGGPALREGPLTVVNLALGLLTVAVAALLLRLAIACARAARAGRYRHGGSARRDRLGPDGRRDATRRRSPARPMARPMAAPRSRRFVASIGAALHASAALATLFVGLPLLALAPCV